jgi:hypothetical protein
VLCRVSQEALRDHASRVQLEATDDKVFEAYREFIEQVASDACDAGASTDEAGWSSSLRRRSTEQAAAHRT